MTNTINSLQNGFSAYMVRGTDFLSSMSLSNLLFLVTIVLFFVSLIVSASVKSKFRRYSKVRAQNGMTGAQAAQRILYSNGINNVSIGVIRGTLTDNYNPVNRHLNLSEAVYGSNSVAAIAVAAHECGHAIQHARHDPLMMIRKLIVPVCNIGSTGSYIAVLLGLIFSNYHLVTIGAYLFAGIVVFNLITLPVEINASRRAMRQIAELNILQEDEMPGARKVLFAAAMTYFISLVTAIVQFARLLALANRR